MVKINGGGRDRHEFIRAGACRKPGLTCAGDLRINMKKIQVGSSG